MKRIYFVTVVLLMLFTHAGAQAQQSELEMLQKERQEYYFSLQFNDIKELATIARMVWLDEFDETSCIAYANPEQFEALKKAGYKPKLLIPPSLIYTDQPMSGPEELRQRNNWNTYPTYQGYVAMMQDFQANYPNLCTIINIGTLPSGRQLLFARINNGEAIGKPEFLYTSSMHGDETTGYVLMLRLINMLLTEYGINPAVTHLVDNLDIWINPLANPDGTYWAGNHTVIGSRRGNANNVDINRNFPDPLDGPNPDGLSWQPETVAFKNHSEQRDFVLSANFHGGIELINYPWDTWQRRHADDNWWIYVSREYADTAQLNSPTGYMTAMNNGITNGYDWYRISGGRQDFMNYFHNCREFCAEISNTKTLPASQLPNLWNYNYRSLLNYMKQTLYGFHGIVTDSISGQPIRAKVEVIGHDMDNSFIYSFLPAGNFHRPIKTGTYSLKFSAPGYHTKIVNGLSIADKQRLDLNIQLVPGVVIADFTASAYSISKGGQISYTDASFGQNIVSWQWSFEGGVPSTSSLQNPTNITYPNAGQFDVQLTITNNQGQSHTILKSNLITVTSTYVMANGNYYTCEGSFYDPGGPNANYGHNQEIIATFYPDTSEALMKVQFISFDLESSNNCQYDWLKIYNGPNTSAPLLGTWCGTNSPGTIIASNPSKALTFHFKSDGSVSRSGWTALLSCFSTVSVNENPENSLQIFPNPTQNGIVQIQSDEPIRSVWVKDIQGKLIAYHSINELKSLTLNTQSWAKGIYLIEVTTSNKTIRRKLAVE